MVTLASESGAYLVESCLQDSTAIAYEWILEGLHERIDGNFDVDRLCEMFRRNRLMLSSRHT